MDNKDIKSPIQELLTVSKAATFLCVSVTTIRRWAQQGILRGVKLGKRGDWRFAKEDLLKMVRTNEQ
ncbi:MAG: helix-turn-helix domain-containing protein [Candidatus Levyibacteriota bacterium]